MVAFFDEIISSKQNKRVKDAVSLLAPKGRKESKMTRFDGLKLFLESVACGVRIDHVMISSSRRDEVLHRIGEHFPDWMERNDFTVFELSDGVFSTLTEEKSPEGIISFAKYLDKFEKCDIILRKEFEKRADFAPNSSTLSRTMALESVRDPGNLGTIIRTCLAFGIDDILLSSDCADPFSPKVIRSSMGAVFMSSIRMTGDMPSALSEEKKKGKRINAAALYGSPVLLSEADISAHDVFVIGNEGHGLSDETLSCCDRAVIIDMQRGPGCESLNASVAASVIAWEMSKCKK